MTMGPHNHTTNREESPRAHRAGLLRSTQRELGNVVKWVKKYPVEFLDRVPFWRGSARHTGRKKKGTGTEMAWELGFEQPGGKPLNARRRWVFTDLEWVIRGQGGEEVYSSTPNAKECRNPLLRKKKKT